MDGKDSQDPKAGEAPKHNSGWKVVVDFDLCESNAICMGIDPTIFEVREDDFLYVLDEEPDDSRRANAEEAVRRCPKQAISIADAKKSAEPAATKG
jgi:ferredoxin